MSSTEEGCAGEQAEEAESLRSTLAASIQVYCPTRICYHPTTCICYQPTARICYHPTYCA
eukprot:51569-Rhodomonas_salina.2